MTLLKEGQLRPSGLTLLAVTLALAAFGLATVWSMDQVSACQSASAPVEILEARRTSWHAADETHSGFAVRYRYTVHGSPTRSATTACSSSTRAANTGCATTPATRPTTA